MKRIYVAGKFSDKALVREAQKLFVSEGHVITYDWTTHETSIENKSVDDFRKDAEADIQGVKNADVIVALMNDPSYAYVGTFGEICMAIAWGKPIFVVTAYLTHNPADVFFHRRCFYHHASVNKVASLKEVLEAIKK